jgi:hypothetical protein
MAKFFFAAKTFFVDRNIKVFRQECSSLNIFISGQTLKYFRSKKWGNDIWRNGIKQNDNKQNGIHQNEHTSEQYLSE